MSKIPQRRLGKDGPLVSSIGLGCMGMSFGYGQADEKECLEVLNRSIDLGCNFWDTADVYGQGANEKLLSKVLKERRSEIFLCTKFSMSFDPKTFNFKIRGDKEYVKQCCDESLKRLQVDYIDLYYQHRVDPKTPIEETVTAMTELVKEGKVKYLGLSECSATTLRRAYKVHPIAAVQVEYSPWETGIEKNGLVEACNELGVAIVAYSPLGRGFLTGKVDVNNLEDNDYRKNGIPRLSQENAKHNIKLVEKLEQIADNKNIKASQLCIAWVLAQGDNFIPIPGTKRIKYLEENIASKDIVISKEEDLQIRKLVDEISIVGERYKPENLALIDT